MADVESRGKDGDQSKTGDEAQGSTPAGDSKTNRPKGSNALSWLVATLQVVGGLVIAFLVLRLAIGWIEDLDLGNQNNGTKQIQTDYPPVNADSWWFTKCSQINKAYRLADYEYLDRAAMTFAREAVSMSPSSRPAVIYRNSRQILIKECRNARNPSFQPGGDVQARLYVKHVLGLEQ